MAPKKTKNKKQTRIMSWTTITKLLQMSTVVLSGQERLVVAFTKQSKPYCCWPKVLLAITRHFWQKRRTSVAYLSYCATFHGFELAPVVKEDWQVYGSCILWVASVDYRPTIDESPDSRSTVSWQSVHCHLESTESRSTIGRHCIAFSPTVGRRFTDESVDRRPTVCRRIVNRLVKVRDTSPEEMQP